MKYLLDDQIAISDFLKFIESNPEMKLDINANVISCNGDQFEVIPKFQHILRRLNKPVEKKLSKF